VLEHVPNIRFSRSTTQFIPISPLVRPGLVLQYDSNFVVSYFCAVSCCPEHHVVNSGQHDGPIACRF
jgi:hypothetical protein